MWHCAKKIFETIGRVISFDESQKFTFQPLARACVLVDTNKHLTKVLEVKVGGKVGHEIKILVLGLPNACFRCKQVGHFIRGCLYKPSPSKRNVVKGKEQVLGQSDVEGGKIDEEED